MSQYSITFDELMNECNIQDVKEFRRLLRNNNIQVPSNKPISRDLADIVARRFTGRDINWYKYKLQKRYLERTQPLTRGNCEGEIQLIEKWFHRVRPKDDLKVQKRQRFLGMVVSGGFLMGVNDDEFSIKLEPGINVLIGDRGTGKSTIVDLLSLLTESVREQTDVLTTKLLNILNTESKEEFVGIIPSFSRRIRQVLDHYGINRYAIFFLRDGYVHCFYIDEELGNFELFRRDDQGWTTGTLIDSLGLPLLALQQGEVIRIAEDKDKYYLNNILDALYIDLHLKRLKLAEDVQSVVRRYQHFSLQHVQRIQRYEARDFLRDRTKELQDFMEEANRGALSDRSMRIISDYLDKHYAYIHQKADLKQSWMEEPLVQLLRDERSLYTLYVGRIAGFLTTRLNELEKLKGQRLTLGNVLTELTEQRSIGQRSFQADNLENELVDKKSLGDRTIFTELELIRVVDNSEKEEQIFNDILNNLEQIPIIPTFSDMEIKGQRNQIDIQISELVGQIVDFLNTRLRMLGRWVYIYGRRRVEWNSSLNSLLLAYQEIVKQRIELIKDQNRKCREVTEILNKDDDDSEINVATVNAQYLLIDYEKELRGLSKCQQLYLRIINATPSIQLGELFRLVRDYDFTIQQALDTLKDLETGSEHPQREFVFVPIHIELLQGNAYREFDQLSFGQKSGIILKMVLLTTKKETIIIDQPEDNLDASSIVNMLAPAINRLGVGRQIIIATHDSNLVMGLQVNQLIALESRGENGRIRAYGSPKEQRVAREMIEILEGGIDSFENRLNLFKDFVSRVHGPIVEIDISDIESSFRRRTIDQFRNFLQPVVSDRAMLTILRHELRNLNEKQKTDSSVTRNVVQTQKLIREYSQIEAKQIEERTQRIDNLLFELNDLSTNLNSHFTKIQEAVEEIRLMDTQSKPIQVSLYECLIKLREDFVESNKRDVSIEIDEGLADIRVHFDPDHLKLVFRNLFRNSLRATERRAFSLKLNHDQALTELIEIQSSKLTDNTMTVSYRDNGIGMDPELRDKLYIERCSDQSGRDHGLGGVIIRKLLDINHGNIRIISSHRSGTDIGTIQEITLRRRGVNVEEHISSG